MKKIPIEIDADVFNSVADCFVVTEMRRQLNYLEEEIAAFKEKSRWVHPDDVESFKKDLKAVKRILRMYTP